MLENLTTQYKLVNYFINVLSIIKTYLFFSPMMLIIYMMSLTVLSLTHYMKSMREIKRYQEKTINAQKLFMELLRERAKQVVSIL